VTVPTEVSTFSFEDAGEIPNNPHLPLVVCRQAASLDGCDPAAVFEGFFANGGWYPAWRWSVYPFPHYHGTAHEVLGVYLGRASIRLGHTTGVTLRVQAGDAIIIPAGVGHHNLEAGPGFLCPTSCCANYIISIENAVDKLTESGGRINGGCVLTGLQLADLDYAVTSNNSIETICEMNSAMWPLWRSSLANNHASAWGMVFQHRRISCP